MQSKHKYPRTVRRTKVTEFAEVRYVEVARGVIVRAMHAIRAVPADTLLEECPVLLFYPGERMTVVERNYAFEWKLSGADGRQATRTAVALGYCSLYNHDPDPNCKVHAEFDDLYAQVWTTRRVRRGEEFTFDYHWNEGSPQWSRVDRFMRPLPEPLPAVRSATDYSGAPS